MEKQISTKKKTSVVEDSQTTQNHNELIAMRRNQLETLSVKAQKELHPLQQVYTKEEIFSGVLKYFEGDALAADVWIDKYALKNTSGQLLEKNPDEMHHRLAKEFARIEQKYPNPMSEDQIYQLFKRFKYIVPQGSPMTGIGNNFQIASLSNCFVIGNDGNSDSYGGIMKMDEEQVQLMKRRGGVGHDLSHIRPAGSSVKNCAISSTGVVPFMERYSNSTREVAQDGRRGALMLSISIKHPDSENFINAKTQLDKITGANVSVKIDDDFMRAVRDQKKYKQQYPINAANPGIINEIEATSLWNKIIHNAWAVAEPGVLFWDTIKKESIPDCYADEGFNTVSTNPCGEIPLCPYDSCRLIALNLFNYVENPFSENATFNMPLFKEHTRYAQRLMDDIIDLELEKIDQILEKIDSDPESEDVKRVEKELWNKIRKQSLKGRRTGLGITAEGDMLAALNLQYASDEAIAFSTELHKQLALAAYTSSVTMANERGAFPIYNSKKELNNPFVQRLKDADPKLYENMVKNGRRNIALLTIAPTGSVSICTQTTSGIEPVFRVFYRRKKKINPNDKRNPNRKVEINQMTGDMFEVYYVCHQKFVLWANTKGVSEEQLKEMNSSELQDLYEQSPYYKSTSDDVDYIQKVAMQGAVQKWVDHSISVTVNMPENVTEEMVAGVYMKAWEAGCKGMTVYRDGCRNGILDGDKKKKEQEKEQLLKRPDELSAEIIRFKNNNEEWIAFIGLKDGRPYEIFTGKADDDLFYFPKAVTKGIIIKKRNKDNTKVYDFRYFDKDGYPVTMGGLSRTFDPEFWNYAKLISSLLRYEVPLTNIIQQVSHLTFMNETINSWKNGVVRALRKFVDSQSLKETTCPNCGQLVKPQMTESCTVFPCCGHALCG